VKVVLIGSGGREHAIAWKLLQSKQVRQVTCIPGNGGTATLTGCQNLAMQIDAFEGIARFAMVQNVSLIIVGPEVPLALGIVDYMQEQGLTVFGPTQAGAQIESSKSWAKALMAEAKIPTAQAESFTTAQEALAYVEAHDVPIVIKADGLAAGKGVTVATTIEAAKAAIQDAFRGKFGSAGLTVLIEEFLPGQEASVLAITDGLTIRPLLAAQDHKLIGEGDTGANTGGMGVYAPAPIVTPEIMERVQRDVLEPALAALQNRGIDYRGVLYAGLMIAPDGTFNVVEFNCRFGDPETQALMPLRETPLENLLIACANQTLASQPSIAWKPDVSACVVMAAQGYPNNYCKGDPISGISEAEAAGALVFHAGTRLKQDQLVTDGGRVLGVTATAATFADAIAQAYQAVEKIQYDGCYYRRDIGYRVLDPNLRLKPTEN
jgi:phosphoribosylamine---glycine ligase